MLVPGAGLGRLAQSVNCYKIQPYIHQFSNNLTSKDQLREIRFPDLDPNTLPEDAK